MNVRLISYGVPAEIAGVQMRTDYDAILNYVLQQLVQQTSSLGGIVLSVDPTSRDTNGGVGKKYESRQSVSFGASNS